MPIIALSCGWFAFSVATNFIHSYYYCHPFPGGPAEGFKRPDGYYPGPLLSSVGPPIWPFQSTVGMRLSHFMMKPQTSSASHIWPSSSSPSPCREKTRFYSIEPLAEGGARLPHPIPGEPEAIRTPGRCSCGRVALEPGVQLTKVASSLISKYPERANTGIKGERYDRKKKESLLSHPYWMPDYASLSWNTGKPKSVQPSDPPGARCWSQNHSNDVSSYLGSDCGEFSHKNTCLHSCPLKNGVAAKVQPFEYKSNRFNLVYQQIQCPVFTK